MRRILVVAIVMVSACGPDRGPEDPVTPPPEPEIGPVFEDVAAEVGLDFEHFNGMSGELYLPESMVPGGAFFDLDNDGDLDVYLTQGNMLGPDATIDDAPAPPRYPVPLTDRLYRNDLSVDGAGRPSLAFTDVTEESGLEATGYGMGVAAGDFDGDGFVDLYVTNFGPNQLWRNNGDGTFIDVTEEAGAGDDRWGASAAFADIDRDGWLDLYVVNYLDYRIAIHKQCHSGTGSRDYCGPHTYPGTPDRLLRNRGDGTFEDVSRAWGVLGESASGLGVVVSDVDGDGWLDIYVANDQEHNILWTNTGDGRLRNTALIAGCAVNADGGSEASMGIDAGDVDGDGDEDLFLGHLRRETNTLYVNEGGGFFHDGTSDAGLATPSLDFTAFGVVMLDFDNDGWLDIATADGAMRLPEKRPDPRDPLAMCQANQLYRNTGGGRFEDWSRHAGDVFLGCEVSRGLTVGDVDNDGDSDLLLLNGNGPARLFLDRIGQDRAWVGLRLVDRSGVRDALGARVVVRLSNGRALTRWVRTDGGYCGARDPRVLVGLGTDLPTATEVEVEVGWPDASSEVWTGVGVRRYSTLVQGGGSPRDRS